MTIVRYCLCGAAMQARSVPDAAAEYLAEQFDLRHAGEGHGPTTRVAAAQARRREDQARLARTEGAA